GAMRVTRAWRRVCGRRVHATHVETFAAFFEEGARGVPHIVVHGDGVPIATVELELLLSTVGALKLDEARYDVGLDVQGTVARWPNEARRRRAHAFDRLRAEGRFLDVYTWR